jgi:hypothetical protein
MVVTLAAVGAAKGASKIPRNETTGLIMALGVAWLVLQVVPKLPNVLDKINIVPETKEFGSGLFNQSRYGYAADQTGSPNPPPITWWEGVEDEGPIPVNAGSIYSTPTPPVMTAAPRTDARIAGEATNRWFTNPIFYPWFALVETTAENASNKTNADYFNEG